MAEWINRLGRIPGGLPFVERAWEIRDKLHRLTELSARPKEIMIVVAVTGLLAIATFFMFYGELTMPSASPEYQRRMVLWCFAGLALIIPLAGWLTWRQDCDETTELIDDIRIIFMYGRISCDALALLEHAEPKLYKHLPQAIRRVLADRSYA